jgi:uncharacterized membrane protein HdeD (DUF308 family)
VVTGLYLLAHPLIGLASLTLVVSCVLFAEALIDVAAFFSTTGERGSGWLLLDAVVSFILAAMIWSRWPSDSTWFLGMLVGVNLIVRGFSRLMIGSGMKSLARMNPA